MQHFLFEYLFGIHQKYSPIWSSSNQLFSSILGYHNSVNYSERKMKNVFQRPPKACRKGECNNPVVAKMPGLSKIKSKCICCR